MKKRIRFTIIFSSPNLPYKDVLFWISPKIGELFAGSCCEEVDGIWSKDGNENKDQYEKGEVEKGMKITLSVIPEKIEKSEEKIKKILKEMKKELNLQISWVHIEKIEVMSSHLYLE